MERFNKIKNAVIRLFCRTKHGNSLRLSKILDICCFEFEITKEQLLGKSRKQEIVFARKAFCQIVKEELDIKNESMAKVIGKTQYDVSRYLRTLPNNKYYNITLEKIRKRVK